MKEAAMNAGNLARQVLFALAVQAAFMVGTEVWAVPPSSPNPPAAYVIPGRTYNPADTLTTPVGGGTQYYVSTTGSDSNPGTAALPFRTIQHGFDALSNGGDTLFIHGGVYHENVARLNKDAPVGNPIIVGPIGDGEVILDGSIQVTSWTNVSGDVYKSHTGSDVVAVVVDNQALYKELSVAALEAAPTVAGVPADNRFFYDSTAQDVYVRVANGAPGTHDTGVIPYYPFDNTPGNANGLALWECNNWSIYGLTIRFFGGRGLEVYNCQNAHIEGNKVVFNAHTGLTTLVDGPAPAGHDGSYAQVIRNFVYFNFMHNWPRSWVWGGWGTGLGIQSTPYALVQGNISFMNGGEGIIAGGLPGGSTFRNNVSADNWNELFYYCDGPNGLIEGNLAVAHTPNPANWYNSGILPTDPSGAYQKLVELSRPSGIALGDETTDSGIAELKNVIIRNNVVINARHGTEHNVEHSLVSTAGLKNIQFVNNTIIMPSALFSGEDGGSMIGIYIPFDQGNNTGTYFENNIVVGGTANSPAMAMADQTIPAANLFLGLTIDHNLVFVANPAPFDWGSNWGTYYTHDQWLALAGGAGHGAGDVLTDPKLTNAATDSALDKKPLAGSPAIDAGTAIPAFVTTDFLGIARPQGTGWDMGAFEQAGGPPDTMPPARPKGLRFQ